MAQLELGSHTRLGHPSESYSEAMHAGNFCKDRDMNGEPETHKCGAMLRNCSSLKCKVNDFLMAFIILFYQYVPYYLLWIISYP